jgi:HK97 family phage portal protein
MTATWYNAERVAQPGSVILSNWKAEREAARIQNAGPTYPSSSGTSGSQLYEWLTGGNISTAGPSVTERTAMGISAVYACIGLIGGAISSLPLPIYRRTEAGRGRINHDVWWLLNEQPCACMSAAVMWEYLIWSLLLHGDAFARIQRASPLSPQIVGFEPVHPLSVQVQEVEERLVYTLFDDGETQVIDQDDMLHIPGLGFDGQRGLSPLRYAARQTFGLSLAAEEYSARFFSQGARPDYIITTEAGMNPEQQKLFRESWMARYAGLANSHIPAILAGGKSDVKALTLSPEEAQLMAMRTFQATDIARIYGVPPHMIGITDKQTSWGSGIEQQGIGFVKYTLQRHLVKIEQEINRKVFRKSLQLFAEFNTAGLERGDTKARNESYRIAAGRAGEPGWMTINEIRKLENLPPVDGGDILFKPTAGAPAQ